MFDGSPYKDEFKLRIGTIRRMLDAADSPTSSPPGGDVSREIRGLSILLLFAAYENLLRSLCRGLLEKAVYVRVGNKRLKSGFQQFAIHNILMSISNSSESKIWKESSSKLLKCVSESRICTVDTGVFPADGSFMKRTQIKLLFHIFDLGDPGAILREIWDKIDTIVVERNNIAHGKKNPEEIGRAYTSVEIRSLIQSWEERWIDVIDHIERRASTRDFYRK